MNEKLKALLCKEDGLITTLANAAAVLNEELDDINWVGFYLMHEGVLRLAPFQGKSACVRIAMGRGVCGTAAQEDKTYLVNDVHDFPGHIACDCASNAEIVVPLHFEGEVIGVLDIDSPTKGRFSEEDKITLEESARIIESVWCREFF
ncbi:MAG: GAF domain-containing protein [Clostridia bacterium]|nr:GAF domain-containing protein [Clostridia bacterium]